MESASDHLHKCTLIYWRLSLVRRNLLDQDIKMHEALKDIVYVQEHLRAGRKLLRHACWLGDNLISGKPLTKPLEKKVRRVSKGKVVTPPHNIVQLHRLPL